jgi:hypothetical protein
MKPFRLLLLILTFATACQAGNRDWQQALVINMTETDVTGEVRGQFNKVHYTIETETMIYFVDYVYKPNKQNASAMPNIAVNVPVQVAIEGHHIYIQDVGGKEVKLHIVKKAVKK